MSKQLKQGEVVLGEVSRDFLWHFKGLKRFRWEWAIQYTSFGISTSGNGHHFEMIHGGRAAARKMKRHRQSQGYENVRVYRRRVQVDWEHYPDTFRHNAKGNGNGR